MNTALQPVETAESTPSILGAPLARPAKTEGAELGSSWLLETAAVAKGPGSSAVQPLAQLASVERVTAVERIEAVERLKAVVSHEVQVLKAAGAGSLAVMLRPDAETELFVQLTRNGDQIEAFVRVEKGDSAELRAGWDRLQSSLAGQQVRLLPLQASDFQNQPQRQSQQHEGHSFAESRGEFRDAPGQGREHRGGREPREERSPFTFENHDRRPSRSVRPARVVAGNGRTLETWA